MLLVVVEEVVAAMEHTEVVVVAEVASEHMVAAVEVVVVVAEVGALHMAGVVVAAATDYSLDMGTGCLETVLPKLLMRAKR